MPADLDMIILNDVFALIHDVIRDVLKSRAYSIVITTAESDEEVIVSVGFKKTSLRKDVIENVLKVMKERPEWDFYVDGVDGCVVMKFMRSYKKEDYKS